LCADKPRIDGALEVLLSDEAHSLTACRSRTGPPYGGGGLEMKLWLSKLYTNEPLNESLVREAEARYGATMPQMYLSILKDLNGGSLGAFRHANVNGEIDHLYGLGHRASFSALRHDWADAREYLAESDVQTDELERLLPLCGDGHWYACLDFRAGQEGKVVFLDVEMGQGPSPVAPDFNSFFEGLEPNR
jgi:hypothetical protein